MESTSRTRLLVGSCALLLAVLVQATSAAGASLPTHARVTIVEATDICFQATGPGGDGGVWTVNAPEGDQVLISLEWRTLDGRPAAAAEPVEARRTLPHVLTLVVCRE